MTDALRNEPRVMLREAGSLFHLIGGMGAKHLVLVGGLVPPLLAPSPAEPHIGSADVDLCLSVAITQGATREYYKSIEEKIAQFFEPEPDTSFRWRKQPDAPGVPLIVDFLAPEHEADTLVVDGTRALDDDIAAANAGTRLRPLALKAGALLDRDADEHAFEVDLVYRPGEQAPVRMRHTGPVGLLAAKAAALDGRAEHKDGYDVAWWCMNADPDPEKVAALVSSRPAFVDPLVPESLALLRSAFAKPRYPGPTGYARLARPDAPVGSEPFEQARLDAYIVVSDVVDQLLATIDWDAIAARDE
jgi:hypothetical protein